MGMPKSMRYSELRFVWLAALLVLASTVAWTQWLRPAMQAQEEAAKPDFKLRGGSEELELHPSFVNEVKAKQPKLLLVGDSITYGWGNERREQKVFTHNGLDLWRQYLAPLGAVNVGYPGDDTRSLIWRLEHGLLQTGPQVAMLLIGINEISSGTPPKSVAENVMKVVQTIHRLSPKTRVLLLGVFPAGFKPDNTYRPFVADTNRLLGERAAVDPMVRFVDIGSRFIQPDGMISPDIMYDGLHLTANGYQIWLDTVLPVLREMLETSRNSEADS